MKEITNISLERMNNGAHYLFMSNIIVRAEADTKVKAKTVSLVAVLKSAVEQEDNDLKISQKSLLTDDILSADNLRDSLFSGYKKAVSGFRDFPMEEFAKAAKELWQHLKDYGIDPKMQLDKETGLLINFVADLEGKLSSQVAILSLTPFVTNLKVVNEKVRTLTASRTDERSIRGVGVLKASRKASDEAYRSLVKMINALALIEGDTDYTAFIDYVNTEIVHYKREVIGMKADAANISGSGTPGENVTPPSSSSPDGDQNENPLG